LSGLPGTPYGRAVPAMMNGLRLTAWLAVAFCVFRGLPVIVHSLREYWSIPTTTEAAKS
jgi:hypothetical protein